MNTRNRRNEKNVQVRRYAKQKGVYLWEVAKAFGVTDSHFSRRLRSEFTQEEKERAMRYIDRIAAETKK